MNYLYIKTHTKTGLKYLGQTSKTDPHKYTGSGKYWLSHVKKHGKDWTTEILLESPNKEDINKAGIYYSQLWNVVESSEWANLKPESGDGAASGRYNPMNNPDIKSKQQTIIRSPEIKEKHRQATIAAMNRPEVVEKLKAYRNTKEYKERLNQTLNRPDMRLNRGGSRNSMFDSTIYTFEHVNGERFIGTRFDFNKTYHLTNGSVSRLINGKYKITQGWKLSNTPVLPI